jgi:endonuclease/exonuclease/phosphatase family metal-dependent hydrolase
MRVASFNIAGATVPGAASYEQQSRSWHHLAALGTDLAFVQDVSEPAIPEWAHEEWTILHGVVGSYGKTQVWGSAIAAHADLNLRPRPDLVDGAWLEIVYDYVVVGEIDLPDGSPTLVASVHAPAASAVAMLESLDKAGAIGDTDLDAIRIPPDEAWSTDVIFHALDRPMSGGRFLVGGDWNQSRLFDDGKPTDQWTATRFFTRAAEAGWFEGGLEHDEDQSWLRPGDKPFQLDYVFFDRDTSAHLDQCWVRREWISAELSDHAPVVADFTWAGSA